MSEVPRLLFVHAHPDDETICNGVTLARYAAQGAEVTVLTCTLGEEGEVIGDTWAHLAVDHADQLGGYRIGELTAALRALGVNGPRYLGGAGWWRDSGMAGPPDTSATGQRRRTRFVDADEAVAVGQLVDVIVELRPHVVVTYDPNGGYGHPDHIQTHRITTAAVAAAADVWRVPKFYWVVFATTAFRSAMEALDPGDVEADWIIPTPDMSFGFDESLITTMIDAPDQLPAKVAAMSAHATQMTVGPTGRTFALSNKLALPVLGHEHYVLVQGDAGSVDERGWESDLLAGLELAR
jgi:N-acetyl-1-D-myo-inositol-2-amino-2-deoxy-alpha-D-glucopyranoside deacetylase